MPRYTIPCTWAMYALMEFEAESLDDAVQMAYDAERLPDGEYIVDSFDVDQSELSFYNKEAMTYDIPEEDE